jgi:hypothetical protein
MAGDGVGDLAGPGPAPGEAEPQSSAAADEASRDGEGPQPEPFRLPPSCLPREGEHLHPGQELAGQGDDLAPDLVLGEALEREVAQAGVLGIPDAVLAAGPVTVPQFQVRELAFPRVGGERGEPVPVEVGEPELRPGCGRSLRTMTRIPAGQEERSSIPVTSATQAPSLACPSPS